MGFEVARQLGAQGVTVFLGARNPHLGKFAEEKLKQMEQTHTSSNSMSQNQDYCQSRRTTPRATGQARHPRQ
jgi:hypothetical protein